MEFGICALIVLGSSDSSIKMNEGGISGSRYVAHWTHRMNLTNLIAMSSVVISSSECMWALT